jgi:hypothetical protein
MRAPVEWEWRLSRAREKLWIWLAWKLPHELVRWCFYRVAGHATSGQWGNTEVPALLVSDAAQRWDLDADSAKAETP